MSTGFLKTWRARVASAALVGVAAATTASASTFGFTGAFNVDNDRQVFTFTVANDGDLVQIRNWGYGGGSFAADAINGGAGGTVTIGSANFDGLLALFDSSGTLVKLNDNAALVDDFVDYGVFSPLNLLSTDFWVRGVPGEADYIASASFLNDPQIVMTLDAGTYSVILSQYGNTPVAGSPTTYSQDADAAYSLGFDGNICDSGYFCDVIAYDAGEGINREGQWAVEIYGVESAAAVTTAVPVPAALPLLAVAVGALGFLRNRKRA